MKSKWIRLLAIASLIAAVGVSAPAAKVKTGAVCPKPAPQKAPAKTSKTAQKPAKPAVKQLPKLLDLGATKCVPCKMMAPILEELAKDYKGQLDVQFIDVWKDDKAAGKYKVQSIPTQIFYDAKGKEFFRHVGFFPKEDILKTFEKQGVKLKKPADPKKPVAKK
jgi:thioredoxin 1